MNEYARNLLAPLSRRLDRSSRPATAVLLCFLALASTLAGPAAHAADPASSKNWRAEYRRPKNIPFPAGNPYSKPKAKLGSMLFYDPILSGSGTLSCASCHNPALSWGDGLARAQGAKPMAVRSPTLLDIAWVPVLGWSGQFPDLESVAFTPITKPGIMNRKESDLVAALKAIPGYRRAFARAFPGGAITKHTIELALATFERTIVAGPAPFDRWIEGDENAIGDAAKHGFRLFRGKAGCAECHRGWNFTDVSFYDIGVARGDDIGRGRLFPTSVKLRHAFKVPTLRDVARRAPYGHDGSLPTLEAVIDLYNRGGIDRPSRSELIKPLGLSAQEKTDLVAFLKTLTSDPKPESIPVVPR